MAKLQVGINDLATVNPELANEWNYEKNYPLTPMDVSFYWHPFLLELN